MNCAYCKNIIKTNRKLDGWLAWRGFGMHGTKTYLQAIYMETHRVLEKQHQQQQNPPFHVNMVMLR